MITINHDVCYSIINADDTIAIILEENVNNLKIIVSEVMKELDSGSDQTE